MRTLVGLLALVSLLLCLAFPVAFFLGTLDEASFKSLLLIASLGWFVFSVSWVSWRPR